VGAEIFVAQGFFVGRNADQVGMGIAVALQVEAGVGEDCAEFGAAVVEEFGDDEESRRGLCAQMRLGDGAGTGEEGFPWFAFVAKISVVTGGIGAGGFLPGKDGFGIVGGDVERHGI
jgi:hypothetical protein